MENKVTNTSDNQTNSVDNELQALELWAESFNGYFPIEYSQNEFWSSRAPSFDKQIHLSPDCKATQAYYVSMLLKALNYLIEAKPAQLKEATTSILITYPELFNAEICVFFDSGYYEELFNRNSEHESLIQLSTDSLAKKFNIQLPPSLNETGYSYMVHDKVEDKVISYQEEWWVFQELAHCRLADKAKESSK